MSGDAWGARCAMLLGLLFLYAAWGKILDPASFAESVYHYEIAPVWASNLAAILLPWVELAAAVCLVAGVWQRPAALLAGSLLVFFILLLAVTWARGIDLDCGCFPGGPPRKPPQGIAEDAVMLLLAVPAFIWDGGRRREREVEHG